MNTTKKCKIYGSTEYVEPFDLKIDILKLSVISRWDCKTRTVCFETLNDTFGGGTTDVALSLERCTYVSEDKTYTEWEKVELITQEIKDSLISSGYVLSSDLTK